MTRLIRTERTGPYSISKDDLDQKGRASICGCGLSATKPFCDDSHLKAKQIERRDTLYYYPQNDAARPPREIDPKVLGEDATGGAP